MFRAKKAVAEILMINLSCERVSARLLNIMMGYKFTGLFVWLRAGALALSSVFPPCINGVRVYDLRAR